jgi:hypothetical protein
MIIGNYLKGRWLCPNRTPIQELSCRDLKKLIKPSNTDSQ